MNFSVPKLTKNDKKFKKSILSVVNNDSSILTNTRDVERGRKEDEKKGEKQQVADRLE